MTDLGNLRDSRRLLTVSLIALPIMMLGFLIAFMSRPADALPTYAEKTGLACGRCHVSAGGGGPRTAFGNAFLANGHKLPSAKGKNDSGSKTDGGTNLSSSPTAPAVFPGSGDFARALAWSLSEPYYSYFRYSADDFNAGK